MIKKLIPDIKIGQIQPNYSPAHGIMEPFPKVLVGEKKDIIT